MRVFATAGAILFAATCLTGLALAQSGPPGGGVPGGTGAPMGNHMGQNNMTQEQFNKSMEQVDLAHRLTKDDKAKGKTVDDLIAEDKVAVTKMVKEMPLSCDVTDALLVAQGPDTIDGKKVDTKTYEASCSNGLGYFLVQPSEGKSYGFS
jgi:hypothetical protein